MTDRYNLHQFYNVKASPVEYSLFHKPTAEVFNVEHLKITPSATTVSKKALEKIEQEWIEILPNLRKVKALSISYPKQNLFDAICRLPCLEELFVCSSKITVISNISKSGQLQRLHFSSCTQLTDISPITSLRNLRFLSFENCFRVKNYDLIGNIPSLVGLELCGDAFAPKKLQLTSLKPFVSLKKLKHLDLASASVLDKSYECILEMKNLERLDLLVKMSKAKREQIKLNHKNLKAGFFMDYDFEKNEFYDGKEW